METSWKTNSKVTGSAVYSRLTRRAQRYHFSTVVFTLKYSFLMSVASKLICDGTHNHQGSRHFTPDRRREGVRQQSEQAGFTLYLLMCCWSFQIRAGWAVGGHEAQSEYTKLAYLPPNTHASLWVDWKWRRGKKSQNKLNIKKELPTIMFWLD